MIYNTYNNIVYITFNDLFLRGLNNLESLSLYGNMISCVTPGAFDELTRSVTDYFHHYTCDHIYTYIIHVIYMSIISIHFQPDESQPDLKPLQL